MAIDSRSQRVRYDTEGSIHVNPDNPSPNSLISKPFNFSYNPITSRTTDLQRFVKFLGTAGGSKFQQNYAILQQSQQELNRNVDKANKEGGSKAGNFLRQVGARALGTILGNVGFTANIAKQIPVNGTGTHFINNTSGRFYLDNVGGSGGVAKQLFKNFLKNTVNLDTESSPGEMGFDPEGSGKVVSRLKERVSNYRSAGSGGSFDGGGIPEGIAKLKAKFSLGKFGAEDIRNAVVGNNELTGTGAGFVEGNNAEELGPYTDFFGKGISGFEKNQIGSNTYTKTTPRYSEDTSTPPSPNVTLVANEVKKSSNVTVSAINTIVKEGKEVTVENPLVYKVGVGNNKIASKDVIESTVLDTSLEDETEIQEAYGEQLIPFSFSSITPDVSNTLFFNAFLDSYTDNYTGTWNGTQYIGRAEQFYTYQGFGRDINFGFKVAAFKKEDINKMYRKLNLLAATTAPSYSEEGNFMRGTLTRITVGDLLFRQNGFITGVDLSWNTSYPWEIDVDNDKEVSKVPHLLDVSVKFTPIHTFNVKSDLDFTKGEKYFGTKVNKADVVVGEHKIDKLSLSEETLNNSGYTQEFQG
tara:strand:- start:1581 stop:3326 length:1746 start_codon:yes stop_codon:yes gene_type:complete